MEKLNIEDLYGDNAKVVGKYGLTKMEVPQGVDIERFVPVYEKGYSMIESYLSNDNIITETTNTGVVYPSFRMTAEEDAILDEVLEFEDFGIMELILRKMMNDVNCKADIPELTYNAYYVDEATMGTYDPYQILGYLRMHNIAIMCNSESKYYSQKAYDIISKVMPVHDKRGPVIQTK